jgi:hypothetical protein
MAFDPYEAARRLDHIAMNELKRQRDVLLAFVETLTGECEDNPGEYPEDGESGKAPCLRCRAREVLAKVKK